LKQFYFIIFIATSLVWTSCNNHKNDIALAKVGDAYLYQSDIRALISSETTSADSVIIVQNYINAWVEQQLISQKAEDELPSDKKDFKKQIEDYKQVLLIQAYENQYLQQHLDTTLSERDISAYYQSHLADFELKSNIIQLNFIKFKLGNPNIQQGKQLLFASHQNKKQLALFANKNADNFFLSDSTWLLFDEVTREIPIEKFSPAELLRTKNIEIQDSIYHFLIVVKDVKIKDAVSPLLFERENIKAILLNIKRNKLLENFRVDIKRKAAENSDFEIFKK